MNRLFWKIFLWFWLAMVLVGVAQFFVTFNNQPGAGIARWRGLSATALSLYGQSAAEVFAREGAPGLRRFLERLGQNTQLEAYLFDSSGKELSGRIPPPAAVEAAALGSSRDRINRPLRPPFLTQSISGPGDHRYLIVVNVARNPFPDLTDRTQTWVLRLIVVLITGGLVCLWLARYLSSPIAQLQSAARSLAGGDLRARVGPAVGNRQDELADLAREFDRMAERIESLMTSQNRLIRDISHELRSPLARLGVALELARRKGNGQTDAALDRIELEANRLNQMIGQLLSLSRLESGSQGLPRLSVDLLELLKGTVRDADFEASSQKRSVCLKAGVRSKVLGEPVLLRSALENVIRNATRHTPEGSQVEVELEHETLQARSWAVIRVRDHGPGVPESCLNEIFLPFFRVTEARDRKTGGAGLGLAITRRAVEGHGGTIRAVNAQGGGLVIEIRLPLQES